MAPSDRGFSTLEVARGGGPAHMDDPGKQVRVEHGKQLRTDAAGLEPYHHEKGVVVHDVPKYSTGDPIAHDSAAASASATDALGAKGASGASRRRCTRRRGVVLAFVVVVAVVVIVASVLGGVLGSRSAAAARQSSSPSSSPASPPGSSNSTAKPSRNLATISFNDTSASHLYLQDDSGEIVQAIDSGPGSAFTIYKTGLTLPKPDSPLAAVVTNPPGYPAIISLYFVDADNILRGNQTNTLMTTWQPIAPLSEANFTVLANSSLATMAHQCALCANTTLIAFQDPNGFVQIANSTAQGWTLTQLGTDAQPLVGTSLALHPHYRHGEPDQVNLFYQKADLNLTLGTWRQGQNQGTFWNATEQTYDAIPAGSPIAAAQSYANNSASGLESWIELLTLSTSGIRVSTWSAAVSAVGGWLAHFAQPSAMANSSSDAVSYGGLAVNSVGMAFGVASRSNQPDQIESWLVSSDLVDWTEKGVVGINGAWG